MSIVTVIKTKVRVPIMDLLKKLSADGYGLVLKEDYPTASFYLHNISIREIEVSEETDGYEIRLTFLACKEDIELYRDTIKYLILLTGGKAFFEGSERINDADSFFNIHFIQYTVTNEFNLALTYLKQGEELGLFCPKRKFYIGRNIYKKINRHSSNFDNQREFLNNLIRKSQYGGLDAEDTPLYTIGNDTDSTNNKTLTVYSKNEVNYISAADFFGVLDDKDKLVTIKYSDLFKVAPISWNLFDEKQYEAGKITEQEWELFWESLKRYETKLDI